MKCKCKTYTALLLGITAGFIVSTILQTLMVSNLVNESIHTNGVNWNKREYTADFVSSNDLVTAMKSKDNTPSTPPTTAITEELQDHKDLLAKRQSRGVMQKKSESRTPVKLLSDEIASRQLYLIAVITTSDRLKSHGIAIHNTWAKKHAGRVIYFAVGGNTNSIPHLPRTMRAVQLEGTKEGISTSWDYKEFAVMKYLISHQLLKTVDWLVVISDEVYVNIVVLKIKLEEYFSNGNAVYMGKSLAGDEEKCNPLTGIIYNHELLEHLEGHLSQCEEEGQSISECIVLSGFHCTKAKETHKLFYYDERKIIETKYLFSTREISKVITIQPVAYSKHMYRLHSYYLELAYNKSVAEAKKAIEDIHMLHPYIPTHLRSPHNLEEEKEEGTDPDVQEKLEPTQQSISSQQPLLTVRPPHVPKNKFELNFWDYFNQTRLMSIFNEQPSSGIIGGLREEARYVLTKAIYMANQGLPITERLMFEKLENGYHRIDPMRGSEYILDFVFRKTLDRNTRVKKRISILRPFHESVVPVPQSYKAKAVNFIVTLSGLSNRLEQFLRNFERNVFTQKEDASLTVVLYQGPDNDKVKELVKRYTEKHVSANINIIETEGEFARGVGLHRGTQGFNDDELLFFVDVDLEVKTDFIHRCQLNTIQNKQAYFPIFFKLYNLDFVNQYYKGNESQLLSRHNGHWAHYSYGMVCIYASDYKRSGGFNSKMRGWGEEDIDFLNRVMSRGLEIFRAPDPGLVHLWHRKECDKSKIASKRAYRHCLQSKAENLADRTELAQYVFQKELTKGNVL